MIRSQWLICPELSEQITHSRSFDLSDEGNPNPGYCLPWLCYFSLSGLGWVRQCRNGPYGLGKGSHRLGNGSHGLGNGPHGLGNEPYGLGNGPHGIGKGSHGLEMGLIG